MDDYQQPTSQWNINKQALIYPHTKRSLISGHVIAYHQSVRTTHSILLLNQSVVAPFRVSSMSQIDLFKSHSYSYYIIFN